MNGLTLRITGGGSKKAKTSIGFAPVVIMCDSNMKDKFFEEFNQSPNSDAQLGLLKQMLNETDNPLTEDHITFLVKVFFQAEPKHPVKCFITRQVTKKPHLQDTFANILSEEIMENIKSEHKHFKNYVDVVTKVSACVENFPAGAAAVKNVELHLATYFKDCLKCCVIKLSDNPSLSPTEKNEIFNLAHLATRLLLYIMQKTHNNDTNNLTNLYDEIRQYTRDLLYDEDVPMDTKSVCGILYLSMHLSENGSDAWVDILQPKQADTDFTSLLREEAVQLSLYSAVITVVPVETLEKQLIYNLPACLVFTKLLLEIGERSSSESMFILGVTRTLLQISKTLEKVSDQAVGLKMMDSLLIFIWSHLEHFMDSVRHLTAQMLSCVVKYCSHLKNQGDDKALNELFSALMSLDKTRKSYYLSISSLTTELGALGVMSKIPEVITQLLEALNVQAVQASATTALETLLQHHIQESPTLDIRTHWIEPVICHVMRNELDSAVLNVLESLLVKAVKWDENIMGLIVPYITQWDVAPARKDLKCILMLLRVVRNAGGSNCGSNCGAGCSTHTHKWKGLISYHVLHMAAVDVVDETRILALSLIVESPKSTEWFTAGDLRSVLYYLRYNINAQAPSFRQLTLSLLHKFVKRLDDSCKVLQRNKQREYAEYVRFMEDLRDFCYASLIVGANYSRRCVALQMLAWCESMHWQDYNRTWKREYVDKLLLHLEDSYENNKALALEILEQCPEELFKDNTYTISIEFEDILQQASSLKPTACTSAAYKFDFLRRKLPHVITEGNPCVAAEGVVYRLLQRVQARLVVELRVCSASVVDAARRAPMYGLLHCITHLMQHVPPEAIRGDASWSQLIEDLLNTCEQVSASVACVVNNSSPEGHLPMDACGVSVSDHGNSGGLSLADGRAVTAQMVLLCAWRSVKEVSLLLGSIASRLSIKNEGDPVGTLSATQLAAMGEHFTHLLAETKHRGAFEQAYVGFTKLLDRLWRCRSAELHELPRTWLSQLMESILAGDSSKLCATRRSAGVPFMIQALVTSEVQALGSSRAFHSCVSQLLRCYCAPRSPPQVEAACATSNVLRALLRHARLHAASAPHVQDALLAALHGFRAASWPERNSATLLFSALMVRTFGVTRTRDHEALCVRNKMTGRIFFLRYPKLYDYMLEQLQEVTSSEGEQLIYPSLYPILLLLARLYPSSLEGTVSNLKLVSFVPHVLSCARSRVLKTRQLAAKAMVPLISPDQYYPHIESMFNILNYTNMKRNYCHGILLQLIRLLDAKPDVDLDEGMAHRLCRSIDGTLWVMQQAVGAMPCYVIADEYTKVVNLVIWRVPNVLNENAVEIILSLLSRIIFNDNIPKVAPGRDICLAHSFYLHVIILTKLNRIDDVCTLVLLALQHGTYDVVLATLNYLLILHKDFEVENNFQEHLRDIDDENILIALKNNDEYIQTLSKVMKSAKYLECRQKCLKVLTIEGDTQRAVIDVDDEDGEISNEFIAEKLFHVINNSHENLTHIYLESLSKFVTKHLTHLSLDVIVDVLSMMFACSTSDNKDENRNVVVGFLENNAQRLMNMELTGLSKDRQFEYTSTLIATLITTLEDDNDTLRQRIANTILFVLEVDSHFIPSKCEELLMDHIQQYEHSMALFVLIALLDFRSEVCLTDEISDECRVFDQNERYNIFLEETLWTSECAKKINNISKSSDSSVIDTVLSTIDNPMYEKTFDKLCNNNVVLFKKMLEEDKEQKNDVINPKIQLFINMIS